MVKISFLGDISFNDKYNELYKKGLNPFEEVEPILSLSDLVVGNLECLAKGNSGENKLKKPRLKTDVATLKYLQNLNIKIVSLAHNHIYDNLLDGYEKTLRFLGGNDIKYIGAGKSLKEAGSPLLLKIKKQKLCFLNFVTPDTNPSLPAESQIFLNMFNENKIINDIHRYREEYFVILLLHWGGDVEGWTQPNVKQRKYSKQFIKEGADLIVGHHSHTMQPYEKFMNKDIYYSLGNFCFADVYSDDSKKLWQEKKYSESAILNIYINQNNYKSEIIPIRNTNLQIHRDKKLHSKFRKRNMFFKFVCHSNWSWNIYSFYMKMINPTIIQLRRKEEDRSLLRRILELDKNKIIKLFKI